MRIYNFKSLYLQKRSMALHENFTDEGLMHFWCLVKISARAIERFLKYVVWNIVHVQPTKNLTYTVYFLTKFIRAETSKHFQSHETKSKRRVISSVGKNKFLIRSLSAFRAFSAHEKGQSITRPNGPTVLPSSLGPPRVARAPAGPSKLGNRGFKTRSSGKYLVTWPTQFFALNSSGKHFFPNIHWVIRNQRPKIRRFNIHVGFIEKGAKIRIFKNLGRWIYYEWLYYVQVPSQ